MAKHTDRIIMELDRKIKKILPCIFFLFCIKSLFQYFHSYRKHGSSLQELYAQRTVSFILGAIFLVQADEIVFSTKDLDLCL